jgi:hypothetical protein
MRDRLRSSLSVARRLFDRDGPGRRASPIGCAPAAYFIARASSTAAALIRSTQDRPLATMSARIRLSSKPSPSCICVCTAPIHWRLFRELPSQACCKDRSRMITATKSQRRRRRGVPSTEDLLRALRAAQSVGWQGSVAVEHDGEKTVVRFEPGAEPVETPNQRGLTAIP